MRNAKLNRFIVNLIAVSMISLGFVQSAGAGMIGTEQMIASESRDDQLARVEAFIARQDVQDELIELGVDPADVVDRVQHLSDAEIASLQGRIDRQVAGSGALEIIGVVFLVLLILELVGVTDIFSAM